ncbi:prepilin peptidase [Cupriavidus sp. UYPR2.512]|uniref:A24 family peptidase n=1 Tax=Cupriavidus sp. UYPR2.512 TaxID=1080187 RepID=UPI00036D0FD6|nr:prepilin peptidase [Cupriavidus sp. UYPR2.512]UIF86858.1 prepilin peptidase [Cupriavidus necator]
MSTEFNPLAPLVGPCVIALVLTAAATDIQWRRIPNWLTFGAWLLAWPVQICLHGFQAGTWTWALGWLTGFFLFLPFYLLRGMAAGDVKLIAAVGAWLGAGMALRITLATFVLGGLWGIAAAIRSGQGRQLFESVTGVVRTGRGMPSVGTLPYGVAIAAGTVGMLFMSV